MATVIKKCGCPATKWRYCRHSWTVRYQVDGRQREKSYLWDQKQVANDFAVKIEHDKRAGVFTVREAPDVPFGEYAEQVIRQTRLTPKSRETYRWILRNHLTSIASDGLRDVASDRDKVKTLLAEELPAKGLSPSSCNTAKLMITLTLGEAVRAGRIASHRISDIHLVRPVDKAEFYIPSRAQTIRLAERMGDLELTVWLMRGCGLRVQEALAVRREDFMADGTVLRVTRQASRDGTRTAALKHRREGESRDVPVPAYVWSMVEPLPFGYLFRGNTKPLPLYRVFLDKFNTARKAAGIPDGFHPHSLRHVFASITLAAGVPVTDVSRFLGHKSIQLTYATYSHFIPSAIGRTREVLDDEWNGLE